MYLKVVIININVKYIKYLNTMYVLDLIGIIKFKCNICCEFCLKM